VVGGADTTDDVSFHAALWRNGPVVDLGTLPGDCASIAWAINSQSQIVGQSFNCDTNISETVLWDHGSIIDLHVASDEPLNINERAEITGVDLPVGCEDSDSCGHAFLLIPCGTAASQSCQDSADNAAGAIPAETKVTAPDPQKTKKFVARVRVRLPQRYPAPQTGGIRH
jgi:hypothetical protein